MSSSCSIYWNIWRLAQRAAGDPDSNAAPSALHRRLRTAAYATLLDTGEEPYHDVSAESQPIVDAQAAAAELLRLRAEGRHGTAARLSWRLDELSDLQQQMQASGANADVVARLVTLLLQIRGLGNGRGEARSFGGDGVPATADVLSATQSQPASLAAGSSKPLSGAAAAQAFDGMPVGRRLRLQPPPRPPDWAAPQPGTSPRSPQPPSAFDTAAKGPEATSFDTPAAGTLALLPAGGNPPAAATGWFPFRDTAGLPLEPSFGAPLDDLLCRDLWQHWGRSGQSLGGTAAGGSLALVANSTQPSQSSQPSRVGAAGAEHAAAAGATAAREVSSVMPLLLGPLQQALVHTRFGHINPLLLRLSSTQSECFRLPVAEAAAAEAASGNSADVGKGPDADGRSFSEPADVPAPFALAALGIKVKRTARSVLPPPPSAGLAQQQQGPALAFQPMAAAAATWSWTHQPAPAQLASGWIAAGGAPGAPGGSGMSPPCLPPRIQALAVAPAHVAARSIAEDEVLLYDVAVMALQGVASALWMLRVGVVRSHCIRLASQRLLLSQLCETGELRLRLGNFVAAYGTYGTHGAASHGGLGQHDEALEAFSDAVRELLALYDEELQELAASHRTGLKTAQPTGSAARVGVSGSAGGSKAFSSGGGSHHSASSSAGPAGAGSLGGAGGGDVGVFGGGMLGLFLCLAPLRIHLQRLADVCMCVPDPAWIPPQGAATRGRTFRREEGGAAGYGARVPAIAPSLWQVYGFPQGPDLLDRLYGTLLQTDHAKTPLLRLLLTAASTPYLRRVRAWMYDPVEGGAVNADVVATGGPSVPSPPAPPAFASPLQRLLAAAGLQMRLLEDLSEELGDIAGRIRRMAAAEAEEARLIAQQYNETLAPPSSAAAAATGGWIGGGDRAAVLAAPPSVGLLGGSGGGGSLGAAGASAGPGGGTIGGDEFHYPLVFGLEALQQLSEAAAAAATARDSELSSLLNLLDRRRQAAVDAADQRALVAAQEALAVEEAARAVKAAAAEERRLARARLLAEQRQALDERAARARAERERRIAEDQAAAMETVLREHNEAAAALAAELARLRASYGGASYSEGGSAMAAGVLGTDERAAEAAARLRRCEWREARMTLAARRRLLWQGIEAEELSELQGLVAAARDTKGTALSGPQQQAREPGPPGEQAAPEAQATIAAADEADNDGGGSPVAQQQLQSGLPDAASPSQSPRSAQQLHVRVSAAADGTASPPPSSPDASPFAAAVRPRRRTYHDSGPSVGPHWPLSGAPGAPASPALRARASDGGGTPTPKPNQYGAQRPVIHPGAKRGLSGTGAGFGALFSPPSSVGRSWGDGAEAGFGALGAAGQMDGWGRVGAGAGFRPPSPGGLSERGGRAAQQPRGYLPSRSANLRAGNSGRVASGGLLLQLHSRNSRRRWAQPDSSAAGLGAAPASALVAGGPGVVGSSLSQLLQAWGTGSQDQAVLQQLTEGGIGGGGATGSRGALRPHQQAVVRQLEAVVQRLPSTDVANGSFCLAAAGADEVTLPGSGQAQRRRALWKAPQAAVYDAAPAWGPMASAMPLHSQPPFVAGAADSPVKALLRTYLRDPRVAQRMHGSPPRIAADTTQLNHDFFSHTPRLMPPSGPEAHRDDGTAAAGAAARGRLGSVSEDLAYAPVGVAVQTCLYGSVLAHYRLTTRAVWHVLVHEYRLVQFCMALSRFFFCEAGDVAATLADSLTRRVEARPHAPPSTAELRAMLDEALQGCSLIPAGAPSRRRGSVGGDGRAQAADADGPSQAATRGSQRRRGADVVTVAHLLGVRSAPRRSLGTGGYFASDVMLVTCQVPRPLDAVITPDCLHSYADIFSLLMRVRCAGSVLAACWSRLNAAPSPLVAAELGSRRSRGAGRLHPLWLKRLALARLWLQAASQVVTLLVQHLQVELQGRCWEGLVSALQGPAAQDVVQMRAAHNRYLDSARQVCMLPPSEPPPPDPATAATAPVSRGAVAPTIATTTTATTTATTQPPGAPLMEALQCTHALATVLRRALSALEGQVTSTEALSAAPRQLTVSPVLSSVSRPIQTGAGKMAPAGSASGGGSGADGKGALEGVTDAAPVGLDLDELWTHVVACEARLGRAMGSLHAALRRSGDSSWGLLGEVAAVLTCEPFRMYLEGAGERLGV